MICNARVKEWGWEESKVAKIFEKYLYTMCENLISEMWLDNACI
jgi:hypothetical protein